MTRKLFTITLIFMIVLSMGTVSANVRYNEVHVTDDIHENTLSKNSNLVTSNDDIGSTVDENIQYETPNLGNKQYALTETPGHINTIEEKAERVIDPNKPMIAITYDDGPSIYTPEILDVLNDNNSVATFFVLGSNVYNNEDILNRMIEEGNQIGNHTYNHKNITTISDEELYKQVQGTDDLIYIATGYTTSIMRPPYGATSAQINKNITKPIINWSIDTRDWENKDVEIINEIILENVKDGDIVLMHDIYDSTAEASKIVIPELINRGFQLVTIDELFEYREVTLIAGEQYHNIYK